MPTGIYISVPFCRQKCSFCNFASGVFSRDLVQRFVDRVCNDIARADVLADSVGARFDRTVDTIYLGGGTPTTLLPQQLSQLLASVRSKFNVVDDAETTVECAPGTLSPEIADTLVQNGINRVSLGVQSFVERESRSVGRTHDAAMVLSDISRLRGAGIHNINSDLIAGLPHQTAHSWNESLTTALATEVPHLSVYMLEVDTESRLGAELIAGGARYHAHHVPDDDLTADFYQIASEQLNAGGIAQYEISNFSRPGSESKHNLKYWTRQPYYGFGLDAHSMLPPGSLPHREDAAAIRFSTHDDLDEFLRSENRSLEANAVTKAQALEEEFFLGLRLSCGISLAQISERHGVEIPTGFLEAITSLVADGLLQRDLDQSRLTPRGRLLSNEVFAHFIGLHTRPALSQLTSC
jgi:oxygen-independent coproporphyrinogen-3 oxidase